MVGSRRAERGLAGAGRPEHNGSMGAVSDGVAGNSEGAVNSGAAGDDERSVNGGAARDSEGSVIEGAVSDGRGVVTDGTVGDSVAGSAGAKTSGCHSTAEYLGISQAWSVSFAWTRQQTSGTRYNEQKTKDSFKIKQET